MTVVTTSETTASTVERDGRALRVTITNPQRLNAIDYDTRCALGNTIHGVVDDPAVRVVVLTGTGSAFCSGADLAARPADVARGITPVLPDDQLDATVAAVAAKIAHGPRRALEQTKRARNATNLAQLDGAMSREMTGQYELLHSADFVEEASAMLQKRATRFAE